MSNELNHRCPPSPWIGRVLVAAGIYNLAWGAFVVLFPSAIFDWTGTPPINHPAIWQCVGMIVGVYGVGYLIASTDGFRHWPIVLVGLLGKLLGPLGFAVSALRGDLPWSWGLTIVTNDLVWWWPFASILYLTFRSRSDTATNSRTLSDAIANATSQRGSTLHELSTDRPLLLLFLRHFGCTFCREALADIAAARHEIEASGTRIALVHLSSPLSATQVFATYGLDDLHRFSDPTCELYQAFGLSRGTWSELLGWRVWWRGLAAILRGHGLGPLDGDGFRMPGVFLLKRGRIVLSYRHRTAADRPDYRAFACEISTAASSRGEQKVSVDVGVASTK